jgi:hypothetical protein
MTVEIHDKLIALLAEVDELKNREAQVKLEKSRHLDLITQSENEVSRCDDGLGEIRENQLRLRREMDGLRDELFHREDEVIETDESHVPTEDGAPAETGAKRAWNERAAYLRKV